MARPAPTTWYVATDGDDGATGTDPSAPLRAVETALARGATRIAIRRGDRLTIDAPWILDRGGSADAPLTLTAYGEGARPTIEVRSSIGIVLGGPAVEHVLIEDLVFRSARRGEESFEGLRIVAPDGAARTARDVRLVDVAFERFSVGINALGSNTREGIVELGLDHVAVLDTHDDRNAIAALFVGVHGLRLERVFVDRVQREGHAPSIFDHSIYVQTDCTDVAIHASMFTRAPDGFMVRAGGVLTDNVVVDTAIGGLVGYVVSGATPTPGGVTATVERNVFLDLGDLSPELPRGVGFYVGNLREGVFRDNVWARSRSRDAWSGWGWALMGDTHEGNVGIGALTLTGNVIYDMPTPIRAAGTVFGSVELARNVFGGVRAPTPFVSLDAPLALRGTENAHVGPRAGLRVQIGRDEHALRNEELALSEVALVDPTRSLDEYATMLGFASGDALLDARRALTTDQPDPRLEADLISAWLRAGFERAEPTTASTSAPELTGSASRTTAR